MPRRLLKALMAWLLLMVLALGNGLAREYWLQPWLGPETALPLSGLTLALLILLVSLILARPLEWNRAAGAWLAGLLWLSLTIGFEFGFGRYGLSRSWDQMFAVYDPRSGNLWLLVLASSLCSPWLAARLRGLV
jgi:hypothetical protein